MSRQGRERAFGSTHYQAHVHTVLAMAYVLLGTVVLCLLMCDKGTVQEGPRKGFRADLDMHKNTIGHGLYDTHTVARIYLQAGQGVSYMPMHDSMCADYTCGNLQHMYRYVDLGQVRCMHRGTVHSKGSSTINVIASAVYSHAPTVVYIFVFIVEHAVDAYDKWCGVLFLCADVFVACTGVCTWYMCWSYMSGEALAQLVGIEPNPGPTVIECDVCSSFQTESTEELAQHKEGCQGKGRVSTSTEVAQSPDSTLADSTPHLLSHPLSYASLPAREVPYIHQPDEHKQHEVPGTVVHKGGTDSKPEGLQHLGSNSPVPWNPSTEECQQAEIEELQNQIANVKKKTQLIQELANSKAQFHATRQQIQTQTEVYTPPVRAQAPGMLHTPPLMSPDGRVYTSNNVTRRPTHAQSVHTHHEPVYTQRQQSGMQNRGYDGGDGGRAVSLGGGGSVPEIGMSREDRKAVTEGVQTLKAHKFSGTDTEKVNVFINVIDYHAAAFAWADHVTIKVAGMLLQGKAMEWFGGHNFFHNSTWKQLQLELAQRFTTRVSPHLVLHMLGKFEPRHRQKVGETVNAFQERVIGVLQDINQDVERWRTVCFLYGLRNDIQEQLRLLIGDHTYTLEELCTTAAHIEIAMNGKFNSGANSYGNAAGAPSQRATAQAKQPCSICKREFVGTWDSHARAYKCGRYAEEEKKGGSQQAQKGTTAGGSGPRSGLCFHCGESGHFKSQCPKRGPGGPSNKNVRFMNRGEDQEHYEHEQAQQENHEGSSSSQSSEYAQSHQQQGQDHTATPRFNPYTGELLSHATLRCVSVRAAGAEENTQRVGTFSVRVDVGTVKGIFMTIDSGADQVSVIHKDVFDQLPDQHKQLLLPTDTKICNADGKAMDVLDIITLPLTFRSVKGKTFSIPLHMYVSASLDVWGILGTDFMLDHTEGLLYTKHKSVGSTMFIGHGKVAVNINKRHAVHGLHVAVAVAHEHPPRTHTFSKLEEQERQESDAKKGELCEKIKAHMSHVHVNDALDESSKKAMFDVLCESYHVFNNDRLGTARLPNGKPAIHYIYTHDNTHAVRQRAYNHPHAINDHIDKVIEGWLKDGTVQESSSEYASPVIVVSKKADPVSGEIGKRTCIDYRRLNVSSVKDAFPLPNIDVMLREFGASKRFTKIDLKDAYHQIVIAPEHRHKTAFVHKGRLYEFIRMPFGLCNAPASFQRLMMSAVVGLDNVLPYLDDIIVFSETSEQHVEHVRLLLHRLSLCGLKVKLSKCEIGKSQVNFLGHIISDKGVSVDPEKIEAMLAIKRPVDVREVQIFLGLCNYYSKFVAGYAGMCKPLYALTVKGKVFEWSQDCEEAFQTLKQKMTTTPVLIMPDFAKRFTIHTDASGARVGAVLTQWDDATKKERVVMYASRALIPAETRYTTTEQELLAVIFALKKFRPYVYGQQFDVFTDHQPLVHIRTSTTELSGRLGRWLLYLEQYTAPGNMKIIHKAGKLNTDADAMSRLQFHEGVVRAMTRGQIQVEDAAAKQQHEEEENFKKLAATSMPDAFEMSGVAQADISSMQQKDAIWQKMYTYVQHQTFPADYTEQQKVALQEASFQYMLVGGILYHIYMINNKFQSENAVLQLCLPECLKMKILHEMHNQQGHQSKYKTYIKILNRYYWPHMFVDICAYCVSCETCIKRDVPHRKPVLPMLAPQRDMYEKFDVFGALAIDIVGPFPMSGKKNKYLLTMIDVVSRRAMAIPLSSATTKNIVRAICTHWFDVYGVPNVLISDNGRNISSQVLKGLCRELGILKRNVLPYAPWSNGINERFNGTIVNMLAKFLQEGNLAHKFWDQYITKAVFAYNTSIHPTTGYSPFFLTHGREARIGSESVLSGKKLDDGDTYTQYVSDIVAQMAAAHAQAKDRVFKAADERDAINEKIFRNMPVFAVGDTVYVYKKPKSDKDAGVTKKLSTPFEGPYVIVKSYNSVSYMIKHKYTNVIERVHATWIKRIDPRWTKKHSSLIAHHNSLIPILPVLPAQVPSVASVGDSIVSSVKDNNNAITNVITIPSAVDTKEANDELEEGEYRGVYQVKKVPKPFPHTIHNIPHQLDTKLLRIDVSSIAGAGLGVFVKKDVHVPERVVGKSYHPVLLCSYVCQYVKDAVKDPFPHDNIYKVRAGKHWFSPTPAKHNIAMYINTLTARQKPELGLSFNCYVRDIYPKGGGEPMLRVYALRSLKAGEELFWNYGDEYKIGDHQGDNTHNQVRIKAVPDAMPSSTSSPPVQVAQGHKTKGGEGTKLDPIVLYDDVGDDASQGKDASSPEVKQTSIPQDDLIRIKGPVKLVQTLLDKWIVRILGQMLS